MADKKNMTLTIDVAINGSVDAGGNFTASANYTQTASDPVSSNVLDSSGNINLNNMNFDNNNYKKDTDLIFNLSGEVTDSNGGTLPFRFPSPVSQAVTISKLNGGGNSQLTPSLNPGNNKQLVIADADDDGATYNYCINIQAETGPSGGPTVALDPTIVNRVKV